MKDIFVRFDKHGKVKMMAMIDGYVLCRRPNCMPFVLSWKEWIKLSSTRIETVGEPA